MFGMRFAPSKCKMLLHDWVGPTPTLTIAGEPLDRVENFCYLGSYISADGKLSDEVSLRIRKARLAFTNLSRLWRRRDIRLSVKGRVYAATVRAVLLYGTETWPLRVEDKQRLSVFDHRCLRSIARIWWDNRVSNIEVRRRVLATEVNHWNKCLTSNDPGGWGMCYECPLTDYLGVHCLPRRMIVGVELRVARL